MTIKSILVPVGDVSNDANAMEISLQLAGSFAGHVECLFITGDMSDVIPAAALGLFETIQVQMSREFEQERDQKRVLARQLFDDLLQKYKIDLRDKLLPGELPSASWRVESGVATDVVASRGGAHDMIVVGRVRPDHASVGEMAAEAALFRTGRPVLVAPRQLPAAVGENVIIGYNRSPSAVHALTVAIPFLERASTVIVVAVKTGAKTGPSPREIATYLARHDVRTKVLEIEPDHREVGEVLLDEAEHVGADLLVMGAFSHSRLRELILGGVTRQVLQNAEIPVLMAH